MEGTEFSTEQFRQIYPDGIENHYWNHARNHVILRLLKKLGINHEPILEIGGGRGVVAKFLHDKGIDITSVELAQVKPAEGTAGYFKAGTDAFELPFDIRSRFTVILLLDVIEHIEDPGGFIEKISGHFPAMKYLLITVPARQELWSNYDEYNGHYRRYALEDLYTLSNTVIFYHGGYFNHVLYPVFIWYARMIKERETVIRAPKGFMIALHRIVSWLLQVDYILVPRKWRGTSCIGLLKPGSQRPVRVRRT